VRCPRTGHRSAPADDRDPEREAGLRATVVRAGTGWRTAVELVEQSHQGVDERSGVSSGTNA
jgi:hypothetical protein